MSRLPFLGTLIELALTILQSSVNIPLANECFAYVLNW